MGSGPLGLLAGDPPILPDRALAIDDTEPAAVFAGSPELRVVRMRLFLALSAMFTIPLAIAAPLVYGLIFDKDDTVLLPTLAIVALAAILGVLTSVFARSVLEPAERLDRARMILEDAYSRARAESLRDALTGLGNHRAFHEELDRQWTVSTRHGTRLALVMIDLDDFRSVNEEGGHAAGDRVLAVAAAAFSAAVRRTDRVFRIGGDEFAILMPGTDADEAYVAVRRVLAGALEQASNGLRPWSFSAGIAALPGTARDRGGLFRQADAAMAYGKRHGRTMVTVYEHDRHSPQALERPVADIVADITRVATSGALRAVFQPIYDLKTGAPRGYEGLVRPLPESGFSNPGEMFAAAEAVGHTVDLDIACLATTASAFSRLGLPGSLTLNLSPRTMESDEFSAHALVKLITRHGVDPARVVIELTEREAVEDLERLARATEACRTAGMRIAADDVGAGNAGLRLLSQLRFDIMKIDLSLVQGGLVRSTSLEVVRTLKDLADRWGAIVIAEGIETPEQLTFVRSLGITAGQGYLLGRPIEAPSTASVDLDELGRGSMDWLTERMRARQAATS